MKWCTFSINFILFVRLLFFGVCHHDHVQCNTEMSLNYSFEQRLKERAKSKKNGANILYFFFALPVKFILILLWHNLFSQNFRKKLKKKKRYNKIYWQKFKKSVADKLHDLNEAKRIQFELFWAMIIALSVSIVIDSCKLKKKFGIWLNKAPEF